MVLGFAVLASTVGADAATRLGGFGRRTLGYTCDGGLCSCSGEDDCNDMFSGTDCNGKIEYCDESGPVVACYCFPPIPVPAKRAAGLRRPSVGVGAVLR
jgi:hypothetical protein